MAKQKQDTEALVASLAEGMRSEEDLARVVMALKKQALESMLEAEMEEHLGYSKHAPEGYDGGNSRNGKGTKTVITDTGAVELAVPRDRNGSFEPKVVQKGQRRLKGFDDKLISLYARGLTVREIQGHIEEMYDTTVSPDLISRVTDQVLEQVRVWQGRQLDPTYAIVYFDGFVVKVRHEGVVRNRTVYVVLAIDLCGHKQVLGLWMAASEGAKFWLQVLTELKQRGVEDILIASVDGLKGFPDALEAAFPQTIVQTCIVHMVRNTTNLVAWKYRKALVKDLKTVYQAATEAEALQALDRFEAAWGDRYPMVGRTWRDNWERVRPFFEFDHAIRRAIYTTNPIEALNRQLRKVVKTRGHFPNDAAAIKLLWLAIDRSSRKWSHTIHGWDLAVQQLKIQFGDRVDLSQYANR